MTNLQTSPSAHESAPGRGVDAAAEGLFRLSNESDSAYAARMRVWSMSGVDAHVESLLRAEVVSVDFAADQDVTVEVLRDMEEDFWRIYVDVNQTADALHSSRSDQVATARALIRAGEALVALNRTIPSSPIDDYVTDEVRTMIADRQWTQQTLADELGWSMGRLAARLNGYSAWGLRDVLDLAEAFGVDLEQFVPANRGE